MLTRMKPISCSYQIVIVGASPFHAEFSFSNHCSDSSAIFSSQCSPSDLSHVCTLSERKRKRERSRDRKRMCLHRGHPDTA